MALTASKSPSLAMGKPGLNDVHAKPRKLPGDLEFFADVHGGAGTLLAVAQRRVEYWVLIAVPF